MHTRLIRLLASPGMLGSASRLEKPLVSQWAVRCEIPNCVTAVCYVFLWTLVTFVVSRFVNLSG